MAAEPTDATCDTFGIVIGWNASRTGSSSLQMCANYNFNWRCVQPHRRVKFSPLRFFLFIFIFHHKIETKLFLTYFGSVSLTPSFYVPSDKFPERHLAYTPAPAYAANALWLLSCNRFASVSEFISRHFAEIIITRPRHSVEDRCICVPSVVHEPHLRSGNVLLCGTAITSIRPSADKANCAARNWSFPPRLMMRSGSSGLIAAAR